jgi:hypothetical protein
MTRQDTLVAVFHEFRDALFASDVEVLDRILAADYRGYNLQGHLEGREVVLEAYAPGAVSLEVFDVEELQVDLVGEVGMLTGKGYIAGSYAGEPWQHHLRFCDIYLDREGAWELFLAQATPMEPDRD